MHECVERHLRLTERRECPGGGREDPGTPRGANGANVAGREVHGVEVEVRPPEGIVATRPHAVSDHGDRSFTAAVEVHDDPALRLTLAVDRPDVDTEAPQLIGRTMTELVVAESGEERRVTGEPCELDGGHGPASGGGLPSVGHVRDLAGSWEMGYPEELRPLDVPHDRQAERPEPLPKCRLQIVAREHVGHRTRPFCTVCSEAT